MARAARPSRSRSVQARGHRLGAAIVAIVACAGILLVVGAAPPSRTARRGRLDPEPATGTPRGAARRQDPTAARRLVLDPPDAVRRRPPHAVLRGRAPARPRQLPDRPRPAQVAPRRPNLPRGQWRATLP